MSDEPRRDDAYAARRRRMFASNSFVGKAKVIACAREDRDFLVVVQSTDERKAKQITMRFDSMDMDEMKNVDRLILALKTGEEVEMQTACNVAMNERTSCNPDNQEEAAE